MKERIARDGRSHGRFVYTLSMTNTVNFKVRTQANAYAEGMKDAMALLVTALEEGGTVDHLLEVLEYNARPETVERLNAFYASRR